MKYSKEFKIECVKKYKAHEHINDPPGVAHKNFHKQIWRWSKIYGSLGEAGFEHNKPTLDISQRLELINRVENGESYESVALSAGTTPDLLIRWHKIYLEKGIDGLQSLKRGRKSMTNTKPKKDNSKSELEQLKEELEYYKAENEYLKKLNALVQKRKAQEQKKK